MPFPFDSSLPAAGAGGPLYRQLYQRFRDAIAQGRLRPGDRVPAVRTLASELGVARGTVDAAYQLLIGEGYLLPRGPAGTVVSPRLSLPPPGPAPSAARDSSPDAGGTPPSPRPFQLGLPALDAFPRALWSRLAARRLRGLDPAALGYPDPAGHGPLRVAIATYLGIARGIPCDPAQVFVTAGYPGALDLICRALLQPGDACWYEDPGYPFARAQLAAAGARLVPLPVDGEGLRVEVGLDRAPRARFAVVTPTHQSPLGVSLSLARRLALLDWARTAEAWIVEDDYDSEYRYTGRPLPALKSLDRHDRVLYTGTFSKVLYPGLRLAYLVVPPDEIARFRRCARLFHGGSPALLQAVVGDFLGEGHFARHLKRMRGLYGQRRAYLTQALAARFGEDLTVNRQAGGMHLLARLRKGVDDGWLADRANAAGLAVQALSCWTLEAPAAPGLLMGFTNLASAEQAEALVERLHEALGSELGR
ncbi:MocR-like pyridoxine biosynthesis transcription factor PdxR [Pseudomonas mangiferae]|uniref:PLP-dependent aminotransferase family protein n=1 Tax=Pseudomonas mangiferae TaxID=2593654 RepID=A0A553GWQ7_9PSED|nr:PLP-dependent aminotransferase family protein [Pseudomonas mangiferae]TRX73937.1 PLP-dependent aminotransferase family protein [Pseudomonas mangiferae]